MVELEVYFKNDPKTSYLLLIGEGVFLSAFFDSVSVLLENGKSGERFPFLMKEFYYGEIPYEHLDNLEAELDIVKNEFKKISADKVVWDLGDEFHQLPAERLIKSGAQNLCDYFLTTDNLSLFYIFHRAIELAKGACSSIYIRSTMIEMK